MTKENEKSIVLWPAKILSRSLDRVDCIDQTVKDVAEELITAVKKAKGLGLSANQLGYNMRMFCMWDKFKMKVCVNPTLTERGEETDYMSEGCLSFPGVQVRVNRPLEIKVDYLNLEGEFVQEELKGMPARIFQHELDHINGKMIFDYEQPLIRKMILDKYNKKKK